MAGLAIERQPDAAVGLHYEYKGSICASSGRLAY
jgi:hypothetical protein